MATMTRHPHEAHLEFPNPNTLDLDKVEMLYDSDLDELTVLYYGKDRRHSLREIGPNAYALVDMANGQVVGIEAHNFVRKVVPQHPSLGAVLSHATIVSEEQSQDLEPRHVAGEDSRSRLREWLKSRIAPPSLEVRQILGSLQALKRV